MGFTCDKGYREPPAISLDEVNQKKSIPGTSSLVSNFLGAIASMVNPELDNRVQDTVKITGLGTGTMNRLSGDDDQDKFYDQLKARDIQPFFKPTVDSVQSGGIGSQGGDSSYGGMGGRNSNPTAQLEKKVANSAMDFLEEKRPAMARKIDRLRNSEASATDTAEELNGMFSDLEDEAKEIDGENEEEIEHFFDLMRAFMTAMAQQTIIFHEGSKQDKKLKQNLNDMIDKLTPIIQESINGKGRFVASALSAGLGLFGAGCGLFGATSIFAGKFPDALNPSRLSTIKTLSKAGTNFGTGTSQASGTVSGMFQAYDGSKQAGLQNDQGKLQNDRQALTNNQENSQQRESVKGRYEQALSALHQFFSDLMRN